MKASLKTAKFIELSEVPEEDKINGITVKYHDGHQLQTDILKGETMYFLPEDPKRMITEVAV